MFECISRRNLLIMIECFLFFSGPIVKSSWKDLSDQSRWSIECTCASWCTLFSRFLCGYWSWSGGSERDRVCFRWVFSVRVDLAITAVDYITNQASIQAALPCGVDHNLSVISFYWTRGKCVGEIKKINVLRIQAYKLHALTPNLYDVTLMAFPLKM